MVQKAPPQWANAAGEVNPVKTVTNAKAKERLFMIILYLLLINAIIGETRIQKM